MIGSHDLSYFKAETFLHSKSKYSQITMLIDGRRVLSMDQ